MDRVYWSVNIFCSYCDMLDAFAFIFLQIIDDLSGVTAIFINRDADTATWWGQRTAEKTSIFTLNIKEPDFFKIKQITIKLEPDIHIPFKNVMGQMVEIIEPRTRWVRIGYPVKFNVVNTLIKILIKEINQWAANTHDGGGVHDFTHTFIRRGAIFHSVIISMLGINNTPAHWRRARTMGSGKFSCMGIGFSINQIGNITLLP